MSSRSALRFWRLGMRYTRLSDHDREILERTQIIPESVFVRFRDPALPLPDPEQELAEDLLWMVLVGSVMCVVFVIASLLLLL
ncbi:MAG: hypothetical protein QXN56_06250 [Candidatus Hadarchaeum sp.]